MGIIFSVLRSLKHCNGVVTFQLYIMSVIIVPALSCLSPCWETGSGFVCLRVRADVSPFDHGTTAFVYHLSRPFQTPAMQCYHTIYDHF